MSVSREQLVRRAGVDDDYVHRLDELGALLGHDDAYEEREVHVAALASPLRLPRTLAAEFGAGTRCRRGRSAGAAEALALAHELHAVGLPSAESRGVPRTLRTEENPVVEEEDQIVRIAVLRRIRPPCLRVPHCTNGARTSRMS